MGREKEGRNKPLIWQVRDEEGFGEVWRMDFGAALGE